MNPNQHDYSVDYLNQIAPQAPKKAGLNRLQLIVISVTVLLVLLTVILGVSVNTKGSTAPEKTLAARLIATEKIAAAAQANLKSSQLRTLNSNLQIYLANTNRDIAKPLSNVGVNVAKLDPKVVALESGKKITTTLEDARLNAVYDRTYAREISYQLETIVVLMRQVYKSTTSVSLKAFLDNAFTNLEPTQKQFSEFNAANS